MILNLGFNLVTTPKVKGLKRNLPTYILEN